MKVALFVPCYIDQFYPQVAISTLELLEKLGLSVFYPEKQTCCGQPMANSGFESLAEPCSAAFISTFSGFDYIVSPSGSCVLHLKQHLHSSNSTAEAQALTSRIFELTEFLVDVAKVQTLTSSFNHKVGLHVSCHGQRGLGLSQMTERVAPDFSKPESLLRMVKGLELVALDRTDECCGFGGTFCVSEEAVSVKMGKDRVTDHVQHGAAFITANDMSCLMHLEGILKRQKQTTKVIHIAEILNAGS